MYFQYVQYIIFYIRQHATRHTSVHRTPPMSVTLLQSPCLMPPPCFLSSMVMLTNQESSWGSRLASQMLGHSALLQSSAGLHSYLGSGVLQRPLPLPMNPKTISLLDASGLTRFDAARACWMPVPQGMSRHEAARGPETWLAACSLYICHAHGLLAECWRHPAWKTILLWLGALHQVHLTVWVQSTWARGLAGQ